MEMASRRARSSASSPSSSYDVTSGGRDLGATVALLRLLPPSAAGDQPGSVAFKLDEDDLFASGAPSPERPQPPRRPLLISSIRTANPSPTIPRLRRPPGGILEALPERFGPLSPPLSSSSTSSSPASSMTALSRMIPSIPRPAPAPTMHMPQSAPVNVPAARLRRPPVVDEFTAEADEDDDEEMLPPHEMVARSRARESPMTTFSVLEGAGCTLKGRDLLQVLGHVCYHILAAGLNGYMATVTNVKSPLNKWRCGAALISSMMTVKRWSRGPASSAMD